MKLALQLLSHKVFNQFRKYFTNDKDKLALESFIELATKKWKIITSKEIYSDDPLCCALGVDINKQKAQILKFINCLESIQYINM